MLDQISPIGHGAAASTLVGTLLGVLPTTVAVVGSLLGIVWFLICIKESRTYVHWKANVQMKHRARKLAKLKAREKVVLAEIVALEHLRSARVEAREIVATAKADAAALVVHETAVADAK